MRLISIMLMEFWGAFLMFRSLDQARNSESLIGVAAFSILAAAGLTIVYFGFMRLWAALEEEHNIGP
jgi:hypothetical protein